MITKTMCLVGIVVVAIAFAESSAAQYGNCSERAETYQNRYESLGQVKDLVCYQKALERELSGQTKYKCPLTAQEYQTAYEQDGRASDLVCFQQALERELR